MVARTLALATCLVLGLATPIQADLTYTGPAEVRAQRVWARMPAQLRARNVTVIEAVRGSPEWKSVPSWAYGWADTKRNLIVLTDYTPGHLAHELGHLAWPLYTPAQVAEIEREYAKNRNRAPQSYGKKNKWEFWADVFRGVFAPGSFKGWRWRAYYAEIFNRWGWGPTP